MSPTQRSDNDSESSAITNDEVRKTFDAFIAALFAGDFRALDGLYDEDYLLVRPDGTTLGKNTILKDLKEHRMVLASYEMTPIALKTKGAVGIFTLETKSAFVRDERPQAVANAVQTVIFLKTGDTITITHFQSTGIAS